jgi:hypothetical protein
MSFTYLTGDATNPRPDSGRINVDDCPCMLNPAEACDRCFHRTGEGFCVNCLFSSGLTQRAMSVEQLLWYLGQMFGLEIKKKKPRKIAQKPTLFRKPKGSRSRLRS